MGGNQPKKPPSVIAMPPSPSRIPGPSQTIPGRAKPAPDRPGIIIPKRPMKLSIDDSVKRAGATKMVITLARALCTVHPDALKSEIKFKSKVIFLDSKKIGDVQVDKEMVKVRIWLQNLGYPFGSLGPDELKDVFEMNPTEFGKMLENANYLVLMGLQQGALSHIGLCFYKDFETRVVPSFPLRD